jgi:hypothetical protein
LVVDETSLFFGLDAGKVEKLRESRWAEADILGEQGADRGGWKRRAGT